MYMSRKFNLTWNRHSSFVNVPCGPLGDWLSVLNVKEIDFFSLDVEGAELVVLKSINWSMLKVSVLLSECRALGCTDRQDADVRIFLEERGMTWLGVLRARHDIWDAVYANLSDTSRSQFAVPFGQGAVKE